MIRFPIIILYITTIKISVANDFTRFICPIGPNRLLDKPSCFE